MTHEERIDLVRAIVEKRLIPVLNAKGPDYAGKDEEVNRNFFQVANRLGVDQYRVWGVYFFKHVMAIETWLRSGALLSEPLEGRIVDAINYLLILWSMLLETDKVSDPRQG